MNGFIDAIERAGKAIQIFFDNLLNGVLEVCEKMYEWTTIVFRQTVEFLARFIMAIGRLIWGLMKILLIYTPSVILLLLGIYIGNVWLYVASAIWFAFVTLVALFYKPRSSKPDVMSIL